jgi:hypothetical protein
MSRRAGPRPETFPRFDALPEGAVLAVAILLAAVLGLAGGGLWLGWLLWGAA